MVSISSLSSFRRRALYTGVASSVLLSCVLQAECKPLYTYFLFFPKKELSTQPFALSGVAKVDVTILVDNGSTLHGWFFQKTDSPYVMLVNHGNGGNIASVRWIANNALSSGVSVLVYDYRGYGMSEGTPSAGSICVDGLAAYDYLVQKGYSSKHIIVYGQSLGCAVACNIINERQSAGLILQSGFSSLRTVAAQHFFALKIVPKSLLPDVLDNSAILSKGHPPLLIMHGTKDKVVPYCNGETLYQAAAGQDKRLVTLTGGSHNLYPEFAEEHRLAIKSFLETIMADKGDGGNNTATAMTQVPQLQ